MTAVPAQFDADYTKGLQKALNEKVMPAKPLVIDGDFGPTSIGVLQVFQQRSGIPATGQYDDATQALLNDFILGKYLQSTDYANAAFEIGILNSTVRTVCAVETSGAGFFPSGQCAILFERHIFLQQLQKVMSQTQINQFIASGNADIINATPGGYIGGVGEYSRLNRAIAINETAALCAASWGLFQIMGMHYDWCEYDSVQDFVNDMKQSEHMQLEGFVKFVQTVSGGQMVGILQNRDWLDFALQYNGSSEAKSNPPYHTRLATQFNLIYPIYQ